MKRWMTICLSCLLLAGCGGFQGENLTETVQPEPVDSRGEITEPEAAAVTDFGVRLLRETFGENTLISPLSVLTALAMTGNGAAGETLAQMEAVFGLPMAQLNPCLSACMEALPQGEKSRLALANSLWLKDDPGLQVKEDFLAVNAAWYRAEIYKAPFDDTTVKDINRWAEETTGGMIDSILQEIPEDVVMYLVNALAFDAEWQDIYEETQIHPDWFTPEGGEPREADFMYGSEYRYLEDDLAAGFLKNYAGGGYAFAALLPKEGVSLEEYVASLTGEHLHSLLTQPQGVEVRTSIPKFEVEYSTELSEALAAMGMPNAFDPILADFSAMAQTDTGYLSINRVLHKTCLTLDERGTKAGAVTAVEMTEESEALEPEEIKEVYLDRPFVYMIIDNETCLPVFLGVVTDLNP